MKFIWMFKMSTLSVQQKLPSRHNLMLLLEILGSKNGFISANKLQLFKMDQKFKHTSNL